MTFRIRKSFLDFSLTLLSTFRKIVFTAALAISVLHCEDTIADTYYIAATGGSDSNSGSNQSQPWKTFKHAISKLKPGDTLLLLDGTFYQTLDIDVSGEAANPILIKALNDGMTIIDGQGVREVLTIEGEAADYKHDIVLQGFKCTNSRKSVYKIKYTRRLTMRRLSGSNAVDLDGNYHIFDFDRCEDILVEDCAAYGSGRILYNYWSSLRGTFRRCWGQWKENRRGSVKTALTCYGSGDCIVENCVMTMAPGVQVHVEGIKINRRDGNPFGSRNKIYGNVVHGLSSSGSSGFITQGNEIIADNEWFNNVSIGNSYGFYQRNDLNLKVNRITIAESIEKGFTQVPYCKNDPAYHCSWRVYSYIQNSSIVDSPTGFSRNESPIVLPSECEGGPYFGEMTHEWNNIYDVDEVYSGTAEGVNETEINPNYDTETYGKGAYLIVPPALKGKGEGGLDIGAEIIFQYLNGEITNEPLWPWPMEERILRETGISVTYENHGGIWKKLPDIDYFINPPDEIRIEHN
jgi:hypothetical protein